MTDAERPTESGEPRPRPEEPVVVTPDAIDPEPVQPDAIAPSSPPADALDRAGPEVSPGALKELAHAFQSNADALRGMHEIQGELAAALRRGDRSELVLQSTNALNETFRNLASIQRELLQRMSTPPATNRMIPAMILGLLIVMLGGIYVIVVAIQEQRPLPQGSSVNVAAIASERLESYQRGMVKGSADAEGRVSRLQLALSDAEDRLRTHQEKYDETQEEVADLARAKRVAEMKRDEMADFAQRARNDALGKGVAEQALREVNTKMEVASAKLKDREEALMRERQENALLRKRIAAYGLGLPDDVPGPAKPAVDATKVDEPQTPSEITPVVKRPAVDPANPSAVPPPATIPGAVPPPPPLPENAKPDAAAPKEVPPLKRLDPDLNRDAKLVARIRSRLNGLLESGRSTVPDWWQITRIAGVKPDRLGGVVVLQYDGRGRFLGSVEANELRIWVDRERKVVEFHAFEGNRLAPGGKKIPIARNGYKFAVAQGANYARAWRDSGLSMVKSR